MKRIDFLKRIWLVVGAIAAMPAVALQATKRPEPFILWPKPSTLWPGDPPFIDFMKGKQWTPAQTKILEDQRRNPCKINIMKGEKK